MSYPRGFRSYRWIYLQVLHFFINVVAAKRAEVKGKLTNVGTLYAVGQAEAGKSALLNALSKGCRSYQLQCNSY